MPKIPIGQTQTGSGTTPQKDKETIEIIHADVLEIEKTKHPKTGKVEETRRLIGHVEVKQGETIMRCDSAILYSNRNDLDALGSVHIEQPDSLDIFAEQLFFKGNKRIAYLYKEVELTDSKSNIQSDTLTYYLNERRAVLHSDVTLKEQQVTITSDSLTYFVENRKAIIHSDVHLSDAQKEVYSDSLIYSVDDQQAAFRRNVRLVDEKMEISTESMDYNVPTQQGSYNSGGRVVNGETILTSQSADYFGADNRVVFKQDVNLTSPQYTMTTAELDYDINTEKAKFNGETLIENKGSTIVSTKGVYDVANDALKLDERATIQNEGQEIQADDFFYDQNKGYGEAKGKVSWADTTRNLTIKSENMRFYDENETVEAFDQALLMNLIEGDTLYITADTLKTVMETVFDSLTQRTDTVQTFYAYKNVRILKSDMQGVCDSLVYSLKDSTFKMFQKPILWFGDNQMYADTLVVFTHNNEPTHIELKKKAFIGNKLEKYVYNQIKGRDITGYFDSSMLKRILVEGNAESVYYIQNDSLEYVGVNKASSSRMWIYARNQEIDYIKFLDQPDATFHPIQKIDPKRFILAGFRWWETKRPKTIIDLLQ
ncbi:MAG: OstA-like protein [Chitinophagales bacterium]